MGYQESCLKQRKIKVLLWRLKDSQVRESYQLAKEVGGHFELYISGWVNG